MAFRLPLVYLVDSAGVFLPLQDEIFPDEDDFGRIFRNNAVISAMGIPQYAAVMGNCVAGGAYLPVLSDTLLMTEGSQLYLAGPALVKAAIGQQVDAEELGGARMHAEISGTADYRDPDDHACLRRLRSLLSALPPAGPAASPAETAPERDPSDLYQIVPADGHGEYKLAGTEWKLLADKRILVFSAQKGWRAFDSISEADTHYADPGPGSGKDSAYFWENGQWNEVDFLFEGIKQR